LKFFFAENLDTVDPNYNFLTDTFSSDRNRQVNDLFAHELISPPPYDGMLVSRATVEGVLGKGRRYTQGQMFRFHREGVRNFLRYPTENHTGPSIDYPIMGDCGAFSYIDHPKPVFTPQEMVNFYEDAGFTHGVSPDHIILKKNPFWDAPDKCPSDIAYRANITVQNASQFLEICRKQNVNFTPVGAVQWWSPKSAAKFAKKLVAIGYDYLGLGGMVGRSHREIFDTVVAVRNAIPPAIRLHIFGFAQLDMLQDFVGLGISSFDSTSPMKKAFKDDKVNYLGKNGRHYLAIKVSSPDESKIKNKILSGEISYHEYSLTEQDCLKRLRDYAQNKCDLEHAFEGLNNYSKLIGKKEVKQLGLGKKTLRDRPWEKCPCPICTTIGIEAILFRGLNRNKRRGFHNLYVLFEKLKKVRAMKTLKVPCIKATQNKGKHIYSFVINGKEIGKFATVSRVGRDDAGNLLGYQRAEVTDHINEIKNYLSKSNSILPNSIVVAFNDQLVFEETEKMTNDSWVGMLHLPIKENNKSGLIVDGQQRVAAIRNLERSAYPISVIAFESASLEEERAQFVLVNNSRPLPKSLIYELLPSINNSVPPRLKKRQKAARILDRLNREKGSPFHGRVRTMTSRALEDANISDTSVLKMLENSFENGVLYKFNDAEAKIFNLVNNYWSAVKNVYPDAWSLSPKKSRLTHGVGILSMGYIMDAIAFRVSERWDIPPEKTFTKELQVLGNDLSWTEGFWEFSTEMKLPWNEIQNISRHIDLVSNFLIRRYRARSQEQQVA